MNGDLTLKHEFVEFIPDKLDERTVYVSIPYATVAHKCCCGCGHEVVTPLSPTDWQLTFDGESISLNPSIGNWSFPCRSHYWIRRNRVKWSYQMSRDEIDAGRKADRVKKGQYFGEAQTPPKVGPPQNTSKKASSGLWSRVKKRFRSR